MGRLFGTDGVRGVANRDLTPELAFQLGRVGAHILVNKKGRRLVLAACWSVGTHGSPAGCWKRL